MPVSQPGAAVIRHLTKHGESLTPVIEPSMLDLLKIGPDTPIEITTDGVTLTLSPATDAARRAKFDAALSRTNEKYGKALRKLAE